MEDKAPAPDFIPGGYMPPEISGFKPTGLYDTEWGVKYGKGKNNHMSMAIWRSKLDKDHREQEMHVKVCFGPYKVPSKYGSYSPYGTSNCKKRVIWEGVSLVKTEVNLNGAYVQTECEKCQDFSIKENRKKISFKATYRVGTMGFIQRSDAPGFWFGNWGPDIKYERGYFTDPDCAIFIDEDFRSPPSAEKATISGWTLRQKDGPHGYKVSDFGWCEPIFENGRLKYKSNDYKNGSWCYWDSHSGGPGHQHGTVWESSKGNSERRAGDTKRPVSESHWVSERGNIQQAPYALRKHGYFVYEALYEDYIISGGVNVIPDPPKAPKLEVVPANGIRGDIIITITTSKEPILYSVFAYSKGAPGKKYLVTDRARVQPNQKHTEKRLVTFKYPHEQKPGIGGHPSPEKPFIQGYDIEYEAVAEDEWGQSASSGRVGGHHYNKAPDEVKGWKDNAVGKQRDPQGNEYTEAKPYTKIEVTHDEAYDISKNNIKYDMRYKYVDVNGRTIEKKKKDVEEPSFGIIDIKNLPEGGIIEFWSLPKDGFEHEPESYPKESYHAYKKGFASQGILNLWPINRGHIKHKRPRIIMEIRPEKDTNEILKDQTVYVLWADKWYNNERDRQYFSSGNTNVGKFVVFKPPVDFIPDQDKVTVRVYTYNGYTHSTVLSREFRYSPYEYEEVNPILTDHVNYLQQAIMEVREAYELPPFEFDSLDEKGNIATLHDFIQNEEYNSLKKALLEVNDHINNADPTEDTDYTKYDITEDLKDEELIEVKYKEWQKLLALILNI